MTGAVQKRMRALPSRVGMYFVLAMTLFPGIGYLKVWDKMTGALKDPGLARPSEKALRGPAPPARRGPGEEGVRDGRGPAGITVDPGSYLARAADGRVRWSEFGPFA
jgi:hypothetical protein